MKSLYLLLNIFSIIIPLGYSIFEKEFHFIQHGKKAFGAIGIIGAGFLIWDAIFTSIGVWGFNSSYYLGFTILGMPFEEWLFFICIPYACLFSHEALKFYIPNWKINYDWSRIISYFLIALLLLVALLNLDKAYTTVNYLVCSAILGIGLKFYSRELAKFYPSFLLVLIPFFIVNGILTGSFIPDEVVWYNDEENLGIRLGTIPIEDIAYAFSMLFSAQMIFMYFRGESKDT